METLLIYAWIILTATANFSFSFVYSGFCKVFEGVYKGAIESSVINFDSEGNKITPYFAVEKCKSNINSYFDMNIVKYVKEYKVTINFYTNNTSMENEINPNKIKIVLSGDIPLVGLTTKSATYRIVKNER